MGTVLAGFQNLAAGDYDYFLLLLGKSSNLVYQETLFQNYHMILGLNISIL
jgi:hypothetical protein